MITKLPTELFYEIFCFLGKHETISTCSLVFKDEYLKYKKIKIKKIIKKLSLLFDKNDSEFSYFINEKDCFCNLFIGSYYNVICKICMGRICKLCDDSKCKKCECIIHKDCCKFQSSKPRHQDLCPSHDLPERDYFE